MFSVSKRGGLWTASHGNSAAADISLVGQLKLQPPNEAASANESLYGNRFFNNKLIIIVLFGLIDAGARFLAYYSDHSVSIENQSRAI